MGVRDPTSEDDTVGASPSEPSESGAGFRYDAFLSYSHVDHQAAAQIQRGLHRVGRPMGRLRALRVFRDETDLTANPDLWGRVTEAMDASRFFVLLASPRAAQSHWVNRELDYWVRHRGTGELLLAVADGELVWDASEGRFDPVRSTAAPRALTAGDASRSEPLFVSFSGQSRSDLSDRVFRERVVTLAAPIHGKSREQLSSDDRRELRRFRRWRNAAATMLVVLLVASVIAVIVALLQRAEAVGQRAEAESQRAEAERQGASSEFRRLAEASASSPTRRDALTLALAAMEHGDAAQQDELTTIRPLISATARGDLPLTRFAVRSPHEFMAGEHQGVAVSNDGSTMAFIDNVDNVELWDLGSLSLRATIPRADFDGRPDQVGLSSDGQRLAVVSLPSGASASVGSGEIRDVTAAVFEIDADGAESIMSGTVPASSPAAVSFGPDLRTLIIAEIEGTLVVARHDGRTFTATRLGEAHTTSRTSATGVGFSSDGRRACSVFRGDSLVMQIYTVVPLTVTTLHSADVPDNRPTCLPEPCGGTLTSFLATGPDGAVRCYELDGREVDPQAFRPVLDFVWYSAGQGLAVQESGGYWSVEPFMPSASETSTLSGPVPFDVGETWSRANLTAARVARAEDSVRIVTTDRDGVVAVWALQASLAPVAVTTWAEELDGFILLPGPHALTGKFALGSEDRDDGRLFTRVVDLSTGRKLAEWGRLSATPESSAGARPIAARLLDEQSVVELFADGTVVAHDLRSGAESTIQMPISGSLTAGEVDISADRVAVLDGDTLLVARLHDAHVVERLEVDGSSCATDYPFDGASFVDLAELGDSVAVVSCFPDRRAVLSVATSQGDGLDIQQHEVRYVEPNSVSMSGDASTVVVSSFRGQVGVLRDGLWIEPAELQSELSAAAGYEVGWASVDPTGRLLITRRDTHGVEMWAVNASDVARIGRLAEPDGSDPPAIAVYDGELSSLVLGWDSHSSLWGTRSMTWAWDRRELVDRACAELPANLSEFAVNAGVSSVDSCRSEPGDGG